MMELIVDSFAGGGGASLGISWALGRCPDIAINHDADAIAMHAANHPSTKHVLEDVWRTDLRRLTRGKPVGLLWASPDCKHFSRAKGGKPVEKSIRSLAWIVCKWAEQIQPRMIFLENVREFSDWGPLVPRWECGDCDWRGTEGQATLVRTRRKCPRCDSRKLIETDKLMPCPERKGLTFKRFTGRLRNLGYRVEWRNLDAADFGAPTHRKRLFLIARRDGQPIEWPEPTHAAPNRLDDMPLFARPRPYRTAAECIDWTIPVKSIFEREKPLAEKTLRRIALGIKRYVIDTADPFIVRIGHTHGDGNYSYPINAPLTTITSKAEHLLVSPTLIEAAYGADGRWGDGTKDIRKPLGTIHSGGGNHAIAAAYVIKHFGGVVGIPIQTPLPTTLTSGCQNQLCAATLVQTGYGERNGQAPRTLRTDAPFGTVVSGGVKAALVYSFLTKYFGTSIGSSLNSPLPTNTTKDRCGLVTVTIEGEPYVVVDIGMRMLTPRELARAQGFPDTYQLTGTKTSQVARIGNSVCPQMAKALVEANYAMEAAC